MKDNWKQIGIVGVDAGLIWIGDPCYCVTPDANEHPAQTWSEFCDKMGEDNHKQFNFDLGHAGLGVCVCSGYGDGTYPVFVRTDREGRVIGVRVDFD